MSSRDALTLVGLLLTSAGALLLVIGDRFPGKVTWDSAARGNPNRYAWQGFGAIAAGTLVQAAALLFNGCAKPPS